MAKYKIENKEITIYGTLGEKIIPFDKINKFSCTITLNTLDVNIAPFILLTHDLDNDTKDTVEIFKKVYGALNNTEITKVDFSKLKHSFGLPIKIGANVDIVTFDDGMLINSEPIKYKDITTIKLESGQEVHRRFTLTRMIALPGISWLAFKKKIAKIKNVFIIEYKTGAVEGVIGLEHKSIVELSKKLMENYNAWYVRQQEQQINPEASNIYNQLNEYKKMLDNGLISEEEYQIMKQKVLNNHIT